jgi:hypothetical protein
MWRNVEEEGSLVGFCVRKPSLLLRGTLWIELVSKKVICESFYLLYGDDYGDEECYSRAGTIYLAKSPGCSVGC